MSVELATKACTKCGADKPLSDYHRSRQARDGRHSWCKDCMRASTRANQARKRAEIGDEAWHEMCRQNRRRFLSTPEGREKNRLQLKAYKKAERGLREAHPKEFEALYRVARHELGLPI